MRTLTEAAARLIAVCGKETRDVIVPAHEWADFVAAWEAAMTPSMETPTPPVEEPPSPEPMQPDQDEDEEEGDETTKVKTVKGRTRRRY